MARCKTQNEIYDQLASLQGQFDNLQSEIDEVKEELENDEGNTELQERLDDLETELECISEGIQDLENYEDPRSTSEQREDATSEVHGMLNSNEHLYNMVLGQDAGSIESICRDVWPSGVLNNESLDNVDWDELESDFTDPDADSEEDEDEE